MAKERVLEDEFDIIEDAGDQALISYYNDAPLEPEKVALADRVKQGITNLGYIFTTNGSKKVVLGKQEAKVNKSKSGNRASDRVSNRAVESSEEQ